MDRRHFCKSIGLGIGAISLSNTKTATAVPTSTIVANFTCVQCGWCCKQSLREGLWKEPLTLDQQTQVMAEKANYADHGGCPALGFKDGLYWCVTHALFGLKAKPRDCQVFPDINPKEGCYRYFKDEIDWKKTKMSPDHLHLIVITKGGDEKRFKAI